MNIPTPPYAPVTDESPTTERTTTMPLYRKKPVVIEAQRLTNKSSLQIELVEWCGGKIRGDGGIDISTLEGTMTANIGDWVIKGVQGEFYPCKPDIFEATYEAVDA